MIVFSSIYILGKFALISAFDKMQRRPDLKNWVFIRDRTLLLKATQQSFGKNSHKSTSSENIRIHIDFWTWQSLQTGWLTQSSVSSVYIKIQEQEEDGGAFNSNCFYNWCAGGVRSWVLWGTCEGTWRGTTMPRSALSSASVLRSSKFCTGLSNVGVYCWWFSLVDPLSWPMKCSSNGLVTRPREFNQSTDRYQVSDKQAMGKNIDNLWCRPVALNTFWC